MNRIFYESLVDNKDRDLFQDSSQINLIQILNLIGQKFISYILFAYFVNKHKDYIKVYNPNDLIRFLNDWLSYYNLSSTK